MHALFFVLLSPLSSDDVSATLGFFGYSLAHLLCSGWLGSTLGLLFLGLALLFIVYLLELRWYLTCLVHDLLEPLFMLTVGLFFCLFVFFDLLCSCFPIFF